MMLDLGKAWQRCSWLTFESSNMFLKKAGLPLSAEGQVLDDSDQAARVFIEHWAKTAETKLIDKQGARAMLGARRPRRQILEASIVMAKRLVARVAYPLGCPLAAAIVVYGGPSHTSVRDLRKRRRRPRV